MSLSVLQTRDQIDKDRAELKRRGLSFLAPAWKVFLARWGLNDGLLLGDPIKSWDLLKSLDFFEKNLAKDDPILDLGAYASEILPALHALGFNKLGGVDLNPKLAEMPHPGEISYTIGDFMKTPLPDGSMAAVTSTSVIEHGFDGERLLDESARLLRPGGYFIASFDYWPEKLDTSGIEIFDMSWTIFSREEIEDFIARAATRGFKPVGALEFDGKDKVIDCLDRRYTFAWLALRKDVA